MENVFNAGFDSRFETADGLALVAGPIGLIIALHTLNPFAEGFDARRLPRTPALVFGPDDFLQHRYLASVGIEDGFLRHLCPSSEGFLRMTEAGLRWGLVPELQVREQLASGCLVEISADKPIDVPLYWHHWRNGGQLLG